MLTHICIFGSLTSTIIAVGKLSILNPAFSSRFQYVQWIVIFFGSAFRARSKVYDAVMKRPVKEHLLGIKDILRNQRISAKRAP
jgi:hypothetical protein